MLNEDSSPLHEAFTSGQGSPLPSNAEEELHPQISHDFGAARSYNDVGGRIAKMVNEWPRLQRHVAHRVSARSPHADLGRGRGLLGQPIPARG